MNCDDFFYNIATVDSHMSRINHCEKLNFMIMAIYEFGARELPYELYMAHNSFDCRLSPVVKIRR